MTALPLSLVTPDLDVAEVGLIPPSLEDPDAAPYTRKGIRPVNYYQRSEGLRFSATKLTCIPVPWATDEAGVAYPAGSMLVFANEGSAVLTFGIGYVVPSTLPVGYTARTELDERGDQSISVAGNAAYNYGQCGVGPQNWRFILNTVNTFVTGNDRGTLLREGSDSNLRRMTNAQMGTPALMGNVDPNDSDENRPPINFWLAGELKQSSYQSLAYGAMTKQSTAVLFGTSGSPSAGGPIDLSFYGPGWRNIRVYINGDPFGNGYPADFQIDSITARVYLDGVLFATEVYTGPFVDQAYFDIADVLPAAATAQAHVEVTLELQTSVIGAPGSYDVEVDLLVFFSPRCDIPLPFTVVGPGNDVAPGGYLPAFISAASYAGPDTIHNGPGVTSCVLSPTTSPTVAESWCATFLPPTTGMWRIDTTLNGASTPIFAIAVGEYDLGIARRVIPALGIQGAVLGRAGKRFTGHMSAYASDIDLTWTLTEVAQVTTPIPGSGLLITAATLTDLAWFFGTIAIPAAGRYRITATYPVGVLRTERLLLCASITDPYVADYLAEQHRVAYPSPATGGSVYLDVTLAAAGTLYLRFGVYQQFRSDPNPGAGPSGPTISWAAI